MKLVSFDIFDTTLLRVCGVAENVFYILSKRLFNGDEDKIKVFLEWRLNAESKATVVHGKSTSINDIYEVEGTEGLFDTSAKSIQKLELAVEQDMLRPYPIIQQLIKQYRDKGYRIAFISDMYLPSTFLKEILSSFGLYSSHDYIYVSNECNARKSDGSLYEKVKNELNPKQWIHYGDNAYSDVKIAKKHGIKAKRIRTDFGVTESNLLDCTGSLFCKYEASILAGITRYSRLVCDNSLDTFASLFTAPIYIPYIHFIKKKVDEMKCKRVYFLSRDAYILKIGFETINNNDNIETHFLFISRKSLFLPYYYISSQDTICEAFSNRTLIGKRVKDICKLFKIDTSDLAKFSGLGLIEIVETKTQEEELLNCLYNSPLVKILINNAKQEYNLLVDYLKQEGFQNQGSSICIDVGWIGTSRCMLNRILDSINANHTHFIYYSTCNGVLPFKYGSYSTYMPHDGKLVAYLEQYLSECPYPSTIGYKFIDDIVSPSFNPNEGYEETKVLKSNVKTLSNVIALLNTTLISDTNALGYWAKAARNSLMECKENIDYSVLSRKEIDKHEMIMARKMNTKEAIKFLFGINTAIYYELPSAIITFGFRFAHFYMPIRAFLFTIRKKFEKRIK